MSKPISLYSYCGSGICIEQDREKDELPAHMTCVSEAEIRKVHSSAGSNHFIFFTRFLVSVKLSASCMQLGYLLPLRCFYPIYSYAW
jgi:hypothetical protein